jgi:hypothetical protein
VPFEFTRGEWYGLNFSLLHESSFTDRHLEGRKRARVLLSGRVALRDLMFRKRKVPRPYSGAEDGAPSLTGARDDEFSNMRVIFTCH